MSIDTSRRCLIIERHVAHWWGSTVAPWHCDGNPNIPDPPKFGDRVRSNCDGSEYIVINDEPNALGNIEVAAKGWAETFRVAPDGLTVTYRASYTPVDGAT